MNAIIFKAKEQNGMIKIPKKHLGILPEKFKVILIFESKEKNKTKKKKQEFKSLKLKTKGFKFDREEAHER